METPKRGVLRPRQLENIEIPASPLMKHLGYGTGANVYKLERVPQVPVPQSPFWAIKKMTSAVKKPEQSERINTMIRIEAELLRKLSHPNIIGFRNYCKAPDGREVLMMEACDLSLGDILEDRLNNKSGALPAKTILKMAIDITSALSYLHNEARILHGDIKSHNILIKNAFSICKLCDFGVSLSLDENGVIDNKSNPNAKYIGTILWSAPEVVNESDGVGEKADIFSFGLVIYETIALIPPHTSDLVADLTMSTNPDESSVTESDFDDTLNSTVDEPPYGTRPPLPEAFELTEDYNVPVEIFYVCTNNLPEDRPFAKDLNQALKDQSK